MSLKRILSIGILLMLPALGCGGQAVSEEAALEPAPGAQNIVRHSETGEASISYELDEPYPADVFLSWIRAHLRREGWEPLDESLTNPGVPSSHTTGWSSGADQTDGSPVGRLVTGADTWSADWVNENGAVVSYELHYSQRAGESEKLKVVGTLMSADLIEGMRTLARHQEAEDRRLAAIRRRSTSAGSLVLRLVAYPRASTSGDDEVPVFDDTLSPLELEVVDAVVIGDEDSGVSIGMVFAQESAERLYDFSGNHMGREVSMIVDGSVVQTVTIMGPFGDEATISGDLTLKYAQEIVDRMMRH